jgi:ectoine hydroxylase-related dioxygenase (phytanoyl-CoA dioxygenase family)
MMRKFSVSEDQIRQFETDGFLMVRDLFEAEEIDLLFKISKSDTEKRDQVHAARDTEGRESKIWLTSQPRNDIYNAFVRCHRVSDTTEKLLGDEIYLYHYKMMVKEAQVGGRWEWHQDYGYWYHNDCLYPDMASVVIAVDQATKANGCLQVIKGSHKCGRIEHGHFGTQTGADPKRVDLLLENLEHVYCEMEQGDVLFFHSNLLHSSDANDSDEPRWLLICCYNTRHNPCRDLSGHPSYQYMEKWPDDQIVEIGLKQWSDIKNSTEK